jgi:hypothetical protein
MSEKTSWQCPWCNRGNSSFEDECPRCGTPRPEPEAPVIKKIIDGQEVDVAHIEKKSEAAGLGCLIQALGVACMAAAFFLPWIAFFILIPLGLILLIFGGRKAHVLVCSHCKNPVSSKDVRICPSCRTRIEN